MGSKVELFARIRRDARVEGLSIRALARRHGVGRRIVRLALDSAEPPPRKTPVRVARQLEPVKVLIDAMLSDDLQAPRKQRHTVRRIFARLADEHGFTGAPYSTVRDYVRVKRVEIEAGAGRGPEVFVPQEHAPGAEGGLRRLYPGALAGKVVLVAGGAGAVGHAAIQLATWAGAVVITTISSPVKAALVRAAGAHHVVNYKEPDPAARIRSIAPDGVDLVVEVAQHRTPN